MAISNLPITGIASLSSSGMTDWNAPMGHAFRSLLSQVTS